MTEKVNEELMESVIKQMKEDNIKFIRLQFVDINGTAKNIVIPLKKMTWQTYLLKVCYLTDLQLQDS